MRHLWIGLIVTLSACDDGGNKGKATCPDGFLDAGDGACEPDDAVTVTTDGQGTADKTALCTPGWQESADHRDSWKPDGRGAS